MEQFEDAFARYVSGGPSPSATPLHAAWDHDREEEQVSQKVDKEHDTLID
jgi:hypothetical protein